MPDLLEETKALTKNQKTTIGEFVKQTKEDRKGRRNGEERLWKEIDRQISMEPTKREILSGTNKDWYPEIELPDQFNALEVIHADARKFKFPRGSEWFQVRAALEDGYLKRWSDRRAKHSLILGSDKLPALLDQETANLVIKAALDHYHRLYDFRSGIDMFDLEMIKYGTAVTRVDAVKFANFSHDFRGVDTQSVVGPAVIPASIWNTYLDDQTFQLMHEGIKLSPTIIRNSWQNLRDLQTAAKIGGKERGWLTSEVNKLEAQSEDTKKGQVEVLKWEGDMSIPLSRGSIFLPGVRITVAVGANAALPIRIETKKFPFNSHVVGTYMRQNVLSPYGVSPLMKGAPIQEAGSLSLNDLLAASLLNADPVITYSRDDMELAAAGGPDIHPGALIEAENPELIKALQIGDPQALLQVFLGLQKKYEDTTAVNDPRRGQIKSHTTAFGNELEATRGVARTGDFVDGVEQGPLTSILYMEYEIIKDVMTTSQAVSVGDGGIEGWINLNKADLADKATFLVHGSAGASDARERMEQFAVSSKFVTELAQLSVQFSQLTGQDMVVPKFTEMAIEAYKLAGIQNGGKFIGTSPRVQTQPPAGPELPGANGGVPANGAETVGP